MSYSNTVTLLSMEGGPWPPVTARLWMLWTVVGSGSGTGQQQLEQGSDSVSSAGTFSFSFPLGPDFSSASRGIGVTLQDTPRVGDDTGWWFRSERFEGPLPTAPLEVVLLSPLDLTRADFAAALPPLPLAMAPARTITFLTVISGSMLVVTASGTTTEMLGLPVTFTCRVEFTLAPSANIAAPLGELFALGVVGQGMVTFAGPPGNPAAAAAAVSLAGLPGVSASFVSFVRGLLPAFVARLETRYTALALNSLSGLIGPGATSLPPGVIASLRSIAVTPSGLTVRGALGAFGGVFSKLPPVPPPSPPRNPGRCFIAAAATSPSSPEVAALRAFRDTHLLGNRLGARFVELYETLSPALADGIRRNRALRVAMRYGVVKPAAAVARLLVRRRL